MQTSTPASTQTQTPPSLQAGGHDRPLLARLDGLNDPELHAVAARAQRLLLDRPGKAGADTPALTVQVVDRAEALLLARYRALHPLAQAHLLDTLRTHAQDRERDEDAGHGRGPEREGQSLMRGEG